MTTGTVQYGTVAPKSSKRFVDIPFIGGVQALEITNYSLQTPSPGSQEQNEYESQPSNRRISTAAARRWQTARAVDCLSIIAVEDGDRQR